MVETSRLESGHTLTGIGGSNPSLSARFLQLSKYSPANGTTKGHWANTPDCDLRGHKNHFEKTCQLNLELCNLRAGLQCAAGGILLDFQRHALKLRLVKAIEITPQIKILIRR